MIGRRSIRRRERAACPLASRERNSPGFLKCLRRAAPSHTLSGDTGVDGNFGVPRRPTVVDKTFSDRDELGARTRLRPSKFREVWTVGWMIGAAYAVSP